MIEIYLIGTIIWIFYCTFYNEGAGYIGGFFQGVMSACVWPYVLFLVLADRFKNQNRPKSIVRDHVPSEWLKGEVSLQEIKDCYSLCYGGDICNHPSLKRGLKCDVEWDKIIPLLNRDDITFKKLDSGFCSGIVAFKDGDVKAHVVTLWRKPLNGNKI